MQAIDDGEVANNFIGQAVTEIVASWFWTEVLERQDCDRVGIGFRPQHFSNSPSATTATNTNANAPHSHTDNFDLDAVCRLAALALELSKKGLLGGPVDSGGTTGWAGASPRLCPS